jgi:hypothetical protein
MVSEFWRITLERLPIAYPETDDRQEAVLEDCRRFLEQQGEGV